MQATESKGKALMEREKEDHLAVRKASPSMKATKTIMGKGQQDYPAVRRVSPTMKVTGSKTKTITESKKEQPPGPPSQAPPREDDNPAAATEDSSSTTASSSSRSGTTTEQSSPSRAGAFAVAGPGAGNASSGGVPNVYGHVEYGSGYDFSGRTFQDGDSTIATNDDNVAEPFAATASTTNTVATEQREIEQVGAYEVNMGGGGSVGGDNFTDPTDSTIAESTSRTNYTTDVEEGTGDDGVKAQVVSQEQQVKEAFEIVQNKVQKAEVMEMDDLLADEAAKHKKRIMAMIVAFLVVVAVVVSVVVTVVKPSDEDSFTDPAPNGKWDLRALNINSTCGPEKSWYSSITIEVLEEIPSIKDDMDEENNMMAITNTTTNITTPTSSYNETTTIFAVEVVGIKMETNVFNGTYDATSGELVIGPVSSWEIGGTTYFTLFLNVTSNILIEGREEWVWRDDEYPGGWGECANGTSDIVLDRVG